MLNGKVRTLQFYLKALAIYSQTTKDYITMFTWVNFYHLDSKIQDDIVSKLVIFKCMIFPYLMKNNYNSLTNNVFSMKSY